MPERVDIGIVAAAGEYRFSNYEHAGHRRGGPQESPAERITGSDQVDCGGTRHLRYRANLARVRSR